MRKIFEDMDARLASFIDQRDKLTLLARLGAREHIAVCKILQSMDEGASPHVFCILTDAFSGPEPYVSAVVEASRLRYTGLQSAVAIEGGRSFPAFPDHLLVSRHEPALRLRELLVFMRSLIADPGEQHLVVALLPLEISDAASYAHLLSSLLEHELPMPWCHHMRFIVREGPTAPVIAAARSLRYAPELSDAALERSLEAEVDDGATPMPLRMQSLMVLAAMDSAHRRTEHALDKYQLLADYHCALGNLPALALALNGMGEACALAHRSDEARVHFERALTPAIDAQDLPTLTNITFNLARLHQSQRDWPVALSYFEGLSTLARASLNAALQVICHEQQGVCLREQGQVEQALEQWNAGATLSEGTGMLDQQLMFLRRSAALLGALGRKGEARELERQLMELRAAGAQELPL